MSPFTQLTTHLNPLNKNNIDQDFNPVVNYIDEFDRHFSHRHRFVNCFIPRFDLEEDEGCYYLYGDIPGVNVEDVNVESCGERRLIVEGISRREKEVTGRQEEVHVERESEERRENGENGAVMQTQYEKVPREESTPPRSPEGFVPNLYESHSPTQATPQQSSPPPEKEKTSAKLWQKPQFLTNHHKPTNTTTSPESTPDNQQQPQQQPQQQTAGRKVLLSERLKGDFHRTFTFPEPIREEGIRASMENGVLEVVVPKVERGVRRLGRRVRVERGSENGRGFGFVSGAF